MYAITHEGTDYLPGEKGTPARSAVVCSVCGAECKPDKITAGYALLRDADGDDCIFCYKCAGQFELKAMIATGRAVLYLTESKPELHQGHIFRPYACTVSNWTAAITFPANIISTSLTNWGCKRTDVRFVGPDGYIWSGKQIGGNNQIAHCRRTKMLAE